MGVALLAEGVDRNFKPFPCHFLGTSVALLAEGVDRNFVLLRRSREQVQSPSSRRAWIEIFISPRPSRAASVALLAEGVDRNSSAAA